MLGGLIGFGIGFIFGVAVVFIVGITMALKYSDNEEEREN